MSVEGRCEICGTGSVQHTCNRCGALVCTRHFDENTGYCIECAAEVGTGEEPSGDDTYQF